MAVSGFEGFEKRLELRFFNDNTTTTSTTNKSPMGLRLIDFESLDQVLTQVQCTVVSAVANHSFDAYVLSESSLFVYPTKIIIKTCGTTQLLKSIRPFIHLARTLNLTLRACRYSRGSFIFPKSQPFPHTSFEDEVVIVEDSLPKSLRHRKAFVMTPSNNPSRAWHVFTASADVEPDEPLVVVEVCMTELDPVNALSFFRRKGDENNDSAGKEMTRLSGIDAINENAFVCDFAFDPCGYSMNGVDGDRYSTIHVTPEDGFSYASFECGLSLHDDGRGDIAEVLSRAIDVFRPSCVSIATTYGGEDYDREVTKRVERVLAKKLGLKCRSRLMDEFPGSGTVVFQSFTPRRR
ncbi:S-adenosylmethionine decarboxylase proenzyme 4 [Raphanus sativus]|uniref:S-adenosylmethionine decarboxylase proenzyme n=1 Tax=Raphanus sativus TaxID=3726 RepID=A0A6J0MUI9_RAPSA|nr:S-adenosylmethionine decarboxylase proenzyme 4-like [Raphanus sativus]KAJ4873404.1 S-adenosylmethionine decarboxylase proenzyme 4 [Raphanus sativus]